MLLHGRKIKAFILSGVFLFSLAFSLARDISLVSAINISESQATKKRLQEKKESLKKELETSRANQKQQSERKEQLDKEIEIVKSQIDTSNQYILQLDTEIETTQKQIDDIQADIVEKMKALKLSLRSIYIAGDTSSLDIILSAKTFEDFLDKSELVRSVSDTMATLIDRLKKDMQSVKDKKASLETSRAESEEEKKALTKKQDELKELIEESQKLIAQYQGEQQQKERELDENDAELKQIEAKMQKYYEEQRRKAEEEEKKKNALKNQASSSQSSSSSSVSSSSSSSSSSSTDASHSVSKSGYTWPVPGFYYISSDYFDTVNRGGKTHGAIDIAGAGIYGAKVVAAADGTVVQSSAGGWGGGYGTYAFIDHGNGKSTRYGHLSVLTVSTGQSVKRGQVIGYVGSTGISTGPHLHFETRLYNVKYNPMIEFNN